MAGCSESPRHWGHYDIPFDEARARLMKADITGFRNARQCGFLIHFALNTPNPQTVGWRVTSSGKTVASFFVKLTPANNGVDASFDIPAAPGGGEIYDGNQSYNYPMFQQPMRPALQELVDAAMEQRDFNWEHIPSQYLNTGPNETLSNCFNSKASLKRGHPWSMSDPPGIPPAEERAGWPSN